MAFFKKFSCLFYFIASSSLIFAPLNGSTLWISSNSFSADNNSLLQLVHQLLIEVSPQQKRIAELKKRIELAQQEILKKTNNTTTPLLSFIIPCYNRVHVIHEVIDSIYNQNLSIPFEVIAVDDASKDDSFSILQEYEKRYSNFFAFRHPENKGAPATRNTAIAYARGAYICNADSDDVFEESIEPMFLAMVKKGYEVAFFHQLRFFVHPDKSKKDIEHVLFNNDEILLQEMLTNFYITPCAGNRIMTKSSWLNSGGFLEKPGHDTWAFSYKLFANGYKAYVHPGSGYLHRIWPDQSNKYCEDNKQSLHDISPMEAFFESPEFFTKESLEFIKRQPRNTHFMQFLSSSLKKNALHFVAQTDLIVQAYWNENHDCYQEALHYYLQAIQQEVYDVQIYLRAARVALWINQTEIARQLLNKIMELKEKT